MRLKLAIIAAVMVVATACSGAASPAPALTTADIELSGSPIALTLWHTQTGANAAALQSMVDRFNSTNGKSVPKTWDEFEATAKAATKVGADGKTTRYGWAITINASNFNGWVLSRGGTLMSADQKTVAWDQQPAIDAVTMMKRMIDAGSAYVPKGFDYQTDFGTAKAAFVQESSTGRPFFLSSFKQPITWNLSNIPQKDPAKAATVQYGANVAIFKSTPEKQL